MSGRHNSPPEKHSPPEEHSRRAMLVRTARTAVLAAIALLTGGLLARSSSCPRLVSPCQECRLVARCRLPRARSARRRLSAAEVRR